jgi:dTDP-4-dehydrorhamnose 3,5-epimerase
MPFTFTTLDLEGLVLVKPRVISDNRGFFLESYRESEFNRSGIPYRFVQDNHSFSGKNVIRGIHFQRRPRPQGKLVRVVSGAIFDVAVDLRKDSPTFRRWIGMELSADNASMLFMPVGFGHAFLSLTDGVHVLYKCTEEYDPALDAGIRWDDPEIDIDWPVRDPILSDKDAALPLLKGLADA